MIISTPIWPYLVLLDGRIALQFPQRSDAESEVGDSCGEWGGHLDANGLLPDVEGMPFLPVYRAVLEDGREILQLSGFEVA